MVEIEAIVSSFSSFKEQEMKVAKFFGGLLLVAVAVFLVMILLVPQGNQVIAQDETPHLRPAYLIDTDGDHLFGVYLFNDGQGNPCVAIVTADDNYDWGTDVQDPTVSCH